jgi:hypothetical protein
MVFPATVGAVIDVILACLNEAAALLSVLSRMLPGFRPIVADTPADCMGPGGRSLWTR